MPHGAKGKGKHPWKEGKKGPWKAGTKVGPWKAGTKVGPWKVAPGKTKTLKEAKDKTKDKTKADYSPLDFTPQTSTLGAQGKAARTRLKGRASGLGFGAGYLGAGQVPKPFKFDYDRLVGLIGTGAAPGKKGGGKKKKGGKKKGK